MPSADDPPTPPARDVPAVPVDPTWEISVADTAAALRDDAIVLLDVREPHETAAAAIPGGVTIPMGELPLRVNELADEPDRPVVVYCRSGKRSLQVAIWLRREAGLDDARSMAGGILHWADVIGLDA